MPTITNLTSGAGSAATSFNTASVSPTGSRLILVSVHAYISTGSVQPATPTVTGNGITYTLVQAQDVDTSGVDRATEWVFRGLATSPTSGAITISFGAVTMTRCAWSVDQSDSDIDLSGSNGYGAIAQRVGATSAGATSLSVSYSPAMRADSAGYSAWGHQVQEVKTPRTSWTELSDVTSVTLATMETQFFSGTDTAASASWTTSSRAGGIAIEIKKVAPFIWLAEYALQGGTTGLTMVPPSGTAAGDLEIIWVLNKNSSVDPTDPSGGAAGTWARIPSGSAEVGTGGDGVGTGRIRITGWWRILATASTSTSITITGANRSLGGGMVYHLTGAGSWATPTASFGSDTDSSTTAFIALMAADLAAAVDEYVLSIGAFTAATALNGRSLTIPNSTQSRYDQINSTGGSVGNEIFTWTDQRVGMVGTQSGASTTGATSGVGTTGGAMQIRIGLSSGASQTADAALSGTGTLASSATNAKTADSALTGAGSLAATTTGSKPIDSSLTGTGTLTATATPTRNADGALAATGSLSASATAAKQVTATAVATGTLTTTATGSKFVDAVLSGAGTLSASASSSKTAAAALTSTGTLTASASVTSSSGVDGVLAGTGTLTTAATSIKPVAAVLAGAGSLTATAASTKGASAALAGTGVLAATAASTKSAAANLAATGTLAASASVTTSGVSIDSALTGTGTLTSTAVITRPSAAVLAGTATATAQMVVTRSISGVLAGVGTLAASAASAAQITIRPNIGTTGRPASGRTPRPYTGTTSRA